MTKYELSENWKLRLMSRRKIPVDKINLSDPIRAGVPGCVHTDLQAAGIIPDPFYADNELKLSWIDQNDWKYFTVFDFPSHFQMDRQFFLVFEGLDTVAEITVNGKNVGSSDNMFKRYKFDLRKIIRSRGNELNVTLKSPLRHAQNLENIHGKLPVALKSERVYIRKAQYSFGWDWGPSFPTMGIWKPVYLWQPDEAWIENVRFHTQRLSKNQARLLIQADLGGVKKKLQLSVSLLDNNGIVAETQWSGRESKAEISMAVSHPRLWWPNGEGEQHLYRLNIKLMKENNLLDTWSKFVGIRTIRLLTEYQRKPTFRFLVNGKLIFCKGANWIPGDSFLHRVKEAKYRVLLEQARDVNMNMIRVWGGGIYEPDIFYEICDELGLLVWQDFMFACGAYPDFPEFMKNISEEFHQNINRLQYHPSLALWCGNNENEWGWFHTGKKMSSMPGYRIYHKLLPAILKNLDKNRPYWPSSPWGFDEDPNAPDSGNRHEWNIWSGWKDYLEVRSDSSLFVTEFGFQGPANRSTLEEVIPETERNCQNAIFEFHNKQVEGNERLFRYLSGHLPVYTGWPDFLYLTQLNQGLALKTCLEHWRLRFPTTSGSIIWQLNDCWPVTSWSLIDYRNKPKLAWHLVKAAFGELMCFFEEKKGYLFLRISSQKGYDKIRYISFATVSADGSVSVTNFEFSELVPEKRKSGQYEIKLNRRDSYNGKILVATLLSDESQILSRNFYLRNRWKNVRLPLPEISLKMIEKDTFLLTSDQPVFFLDLYHPGLTFHDRGHILLPQEEVRIRFSNNSEIVPDARDIDIKHLNYYLTI